MARKLRIRDTGRVKTKDVWVVAEHSKDKVQEVTFEMLGEARQLAEQLGGQSCIVLMGDGLATPLRILANQNVDTVYVVQDPLLGDYTSDAYASALISLIKEHSPYIVILGATANGSDLASAVSARMQTGLIPGCTALKINDQGVLEATRPVYQDKVYSTVVLQATAFPRIATIQPGAIGVEKTKPSESVQIIEVKPNIRAESIRTKVIGYVEADAKTLDIAEAEIIVAGGRGVPENDWQMVEELADVLGGGVGGSRMAMDDGLITREQLVGQSGKSVKPALYIAIGISGASQHTEGMKESEHVIAINKDPAAPIFKLANLSIVGDVAEVVPLLIRKLRQLPERAEIRE